jgi:hypothetical protein
MQIFQNAKEFTVAHFSTIVLCLGCLFIFSSTLDINSNRNPKDTNDKLNTYYGLNVTALVFLSLFIGNEYVLPYISNMR